MFWMMVQRKEKWKKVNEVQHLPERGHNIKYSYVLGLNHSLKS